ncbi:MAG: metalloregulator ArsR/SmtB family transcription factor [Bacteroidetes bacterium]|nr:metalloregulator ArsR/SmtB family transcription factor [Bacteroidota bacterium]MBU1720248.1 metalloregulator ArsR/SmtB family transcription factor [Bacteroidota bacterium]
MPKSYLDVEKLEEAAKKLKAMAHPMRIAIVELLQNNKKLSVTQIYKKLNIEQAITSHHLGILKDKGIVSSSRVGKNIFYELKHKQISHIVDCINSCGSR